MSTSDGQKPLPKPVPETTGRRPWSKPKLAEFGHIGKLTLGASGMNAETTGKKIVPCL